MGRRSPEEMHKIREDFVKKMSQRGITLRRIEKHIYRINSERPGKEHKVGIACSTHGPRNAKWYASMHEESFEIAVLRCKLGSEDMTGFTDICLPRNFIRKHSHNIKRASPTKKMASKKIGFNLLKENNTYSLLVADTWVDISEFVENFSPLH